MPDLVQITVTQIPDNVSVAVDESRDIVSVAVSNQAGPSGPGVAPGGDVGQVLKKTGTPDFETGWLTVGTACTKDTGTSEGTVPILGTGGKLADSVIPAIALTEYLGTVASEAAMTALVGSYGDWCIRSDQGKVYVVTAVPSSSAGNWTALAYPADAVLSVAGRTGAVTLASADITDASEGGNGSQDSGKVVIFQTNGSLLAEHFRTPTVAVDDGTVGSTFTATSIAVSKTTNQTNTLGNTDAGNLDTGDTYIWSWPAGTGTFALCASPSGAIAASDVSGLGSLATASSVASTQISDAGTTGKALLTSSTVANAFSALNIVEVVRSTDNGRSYNAAAVDDEVLQLSLAANSVYVVDYGIIGTNSSSGIGGQFNYSAALAAAANEICGGLIAASAGQLSWVSVSPTAASGSIIVSTAAQCGVFGTILVRTSGAGTLTFAWRNYQNTGGTATIKTGSFMRRRKIA